MRCCVQPVEFPAPLWTRVEILGRGRGNVPAGAWLTFVGPALSPDTCGLSRDARFLPAGVAPECTSVYSRNQSHHLFVQNIGQGSVCAGITNGIVLECTNHAVLPSYSQLTSEKLAAKYTHQDSASAKCASPPP